MAWPDMYYINAKGERFTLNGDGYTYTDPQPLRSFSWDYSVSNRLNGYGGRASGFARRPRTIELEVRMRGEVGNIADFKTRMNRFHAVADADCIDETPGRLYVGSQYITCYLAVSGSIDNNASFTWYAYRKVTVLAVEPYWCTDVTTIYNVKDSTQDTTGKKFDLRYPYRYNTGLSSSVLLNTHYASCPAVITIYGPTSNPAVVINGVIYNVDVQVGASERLVIDQTSSEIYTVNSAGQKTNVFGKRNKEYDIFGRIPAGEIPISYDGTFKMAITLVKQRSELEWV